MNILSFLLEIILAGLISFTLTGFVRTYVLKMHWLQPIRKRDVHKTPIPRFGGVAIFISFWLIIFSVLYFNSSRLSFGDSIIWGLDKKLFGVLLGAVIIFLVGLWDDKSNLHWSIKLAAQGISALVVVYFGINISTLSNPFGPNLDLGSFGIVFVVLWMVILMNAVNWLDGLDGLATGVGAIAALILGLLATSSKVNQPATALLSFILLGSLLGFLPWNFHPAKIFLGDTGSLFLGYIISVLAVISGGKVATAALVLGLPLLDFIWVVTRRLINGHSPFYADKLHLHHRLIKAGFSVEQAVLFLYLISAIFGAIALNTQTYAKFQAAIILIVIIIILGLLLIYGPKRRKNS